MSLSLASVAGALVEFCNPADSSCVTVTRWRNDCSHDVFSSTSSRRPKKGLTAEPCDLRECRAGGANQRRGSSRREHSAYEGGGIAQQAIARCPRHSVTLPSQSTANTLVCHSRLRGIDGSYSY